MKGQGRWNVKRHYPFLYLGLHLMKKGLDFFVIWGISNLENFPSNKEGLLIGREDFHFIT